MASIGRCENMAAIERATEIMFDQVGDVVLPDYKIYIKPNPELFAKRKSTKLNESQKELVRQTEADLASQSTKGVFMSNMHDDFTSAVIEECVAFIEELK